MTRKKKEDNVIETAEKAHGADVEIEKDEENQDAQRN